MIIALLIALGVVALNATTQCSRVALAKRAAIHEQRQRARVLS